MAKVWVRKGYCPHGQASDVLVKYGGVLIHYYFCICEDHKKGCAETTGGRVV